MLANDAGMAFVSEVDGMIEETTQCQVSWLAEAMHT
jgi:hypothetical protein